MITDGKFSLSAFHQAIMLNPCYVLIRAWLDAWKNYPDVNQKISGCERYIYTWRDEKTSLLRNYFAALRADLEAERNYLLLKVKQLKTPLYDAMTEQTIVGERLISVTKKQEIDELAEKSTPLKHNVEDSRLRMLQAKEEAEPYLRTLSSRSILSNVLYWAYLFLIWLVELPFNYYAAIKVFNDSSAFGIPFTLLVSALLPASSHALGKTLAQPRRDIRSVVMTVLATAFATVLIVFMAFLRAKGLEVDSQVVSQALSDAVSASTLTFCVFLLVQSGMLTLSVYYSYKHYEGEDSKSLKAIRHAQRRYKAAASDYAVNQKHVDQLNAANKVLSSRLAGLTQSEAMEKEKIRSRAEKLLGKYRAVNRKRRKEDNVPDWWHDEDERLVQSIRGWAPVNAASSSASVNGNGTAGINGNQHQRRNNVQI